MRKSPLPCFGSSSTLLPPPRHGTKTPPVARGGRGRGRPVPTAAVAAARRGRGGAAPPPLSPNRVTGGAARVCLRARECGPNSEDRSRPPRSTLAARAQRDRGLGAVPPGGARLSPAPRLPCPSPATHRPTLLRDARGEASARSSVLARICAPRPSLLSEVGLAEPQLLPGDRGAEKTAPAARPSRRGAASTGNKGDKAASAGPGSAPSTHPHPPPVGPPFPRAPPGPGRKQPGERGTRAQPSRTPYSGPAGSEFVEGLGG